MRARRSDFQTVALEKDDKAMRAYHTVGGWTYWAAACGLTLLSTGCYSSGAGWSAPRLSSLNPWASSSTSVADQRGGPQTPSAASTPAYPHTTQAGLPGSPAAPGGGHYPIGNYNMTAGGNPAAPGAAGNPAAGPSAGPGGVAVTPPAAGTNQGFYNEAYNGAPGGNPAVNQPVQYTADARGQFPPTAPPNFESQPAPPANPAWPSNPAPAAGIPNGSFEAPPAGAPAWPNAPVNHGPAAPAWPGAASLPADNAPGANPAAPPPTNPGFSDNSSFAPPASFGAPPPAAAPPAAPPNTTYFGDSPPAGSMMGSLPPPVAPPGGANSAPQHRADPMYRPGTTKNYLPTTPGGVQPATFERPANNPWPNAPGS